MLGKVVPRPGHAGRIYYRDIIEQFEAIGVGSLTVVLLTGMFTGMVLALQSGFTLDQFGARSMVGRLVSASMVKELGPVLTGLMVAGRVGSGIAAELGSMMVTDQIAALRALGTDPIRKLVVPRMLAGLVMVPLLTVISERRRHGRRLDRHRRRCCASRRRSTGTRSCRASTSRTSGWASSSRSSSASRSSASAATSGCGRRGGTQGVGRATTNAVVASSVAVIAVDFLVTKLLIVLMY